MIFKYIIILLKIRFYINMCRKGHGENIVYQGTRDKKDRNDFVNIPCVTRDKKDKNQLL